MKELIKNLIQEKVLIIDGAMGTQLQIADIKKEEWFFENQDLEGCNELLNLTAPHILENIHDNYAKAGADLISTNTFGSMPWVLDEYGIGHMSYELSRLGAALVKKSCEKYSTPQNPKFVVASVGPGTKLPSLGHIKYDEMYEGYKIMAKAVSFLKCQVMNGKNMPICAQCTRICTHIRGINCFLWAENSGKLTNGILVKV
jgi:5-methyltetrahydrofolate--homocysteine methyltransferase